MAIRIAVDGMGGDYAPREAVAGAVESLRGRDGLEVILVGDEKALRAELNKHETKGLPLRVVHASQVVGMDEHPVKAIREKKDSSIVVSMGLVKKGEADGVVAAGSTGAAMAGALFGLGRLEGIERPAIAIPMPTKNGITLVIDAGANVDCRPKHLAQFALMGSVYAKHILGTHNPRVGLLNIGEEETKGNELTLETYPLLKSSGLNFVGNVQGREMFSDVADVIVCDGFVGNVVLKTAEGLGLAILSTLRDSIMKGTASRLGALFMRKAFRNVKRKMDYREYGGAPLLGVNGVCMIGHGSSNGAAFKNAIWAAEKEVKCEINKHIRDSFKAEGVSKSEAEASRMTA
jgi:glycerol-3-phosphate acyltransferase PlsX